MARTLPVAEINEIGNAISTASVALAQREGERDKAITDLQRLSDSLEKMVSNGGSLQQFAHEKSNFRWDG